METHCFLPQLTRVYTHNSYIQSIEWKHSKTFEELNHIKMCHLGSYRIYVR